MKSAVKIFMIFAMVFLWLGKPLIAQDNPKKVEKSALKEYLDSIGKKKEKKKNEKKEINKGNASTLTKLYKPESQNVQTNNEGDEYLEQQSSADASVIKYKETFHNYSFGMASEPGVIVAYAEFDNNHNLILLKRYDVDGYLSKYEKYSYNKNNSLTEIKNFDEDGIIEKKTIIDYDKNDNPISKIIYNDDGEVELKETYVIGDCRDTLDYTQYSYDGELVFKKNKMFDNNCNVEKITIYDADGEISSMKKYVYDEYNRNTREEVYEDGNSISYYYVKEYLPEMMNYKSVAKYDYDGNLESKTVYNYNDIGLIEEVTYDESNEVIAKVKYESDSNGNVTLMNKYEADNYLVSSISYKYSPQGNIIEEEKRGEDGEFISKERYEYDDSGEYVLRTVRYSVLDEPINEIRSEFF